MHVQVEGDRLYALWLLAATSGMRRSELCGLPWSAVDLEAGTVAVVQTAIRVGKLVRLVPDTKSPTSRRRFELDPATLAALKRHRAQQHRERLAAGAAWQDSGLVFTDELGAGYDAASDTAFDCVKASAGY
jgi:integrase